MCPNPVQFSYSIGEKTGPQKVGMTGFKTCCSLSSDTGQESRILDVQRSSMSTLGAYIDKHSYAWCHWQLESWVSRF